MTFEEAVKNIPKGRYRHYKGNDYEVICIAKHSETLEPVVVYQALYGDQQIWVRPATMWNEPVCDGQMLRFTKIDKRTRLLTAEQLEKIRSANESVKGTFDYRKYNMCKETKSKKERWSPWTMVGWDIPRRRAYYYFKSIRDKLYIMSSEYSVDGCTYMERYEVTENIKELLKL